MRTTISIMAALLLALGCGRQTAPAPMDAPAFTQAFATALQAQDQALRVTVVGDLELAVDGSGGDFWRLHLATSFAEYQAAPDTLDALVRRARQQVLRPLAEPATPDPAATGDGQAGIDRTRIVPIVRNAGYAVAFGAREGEDGAIFQSLNQQLTVFYLVRQRADLQSTVWDQPLTVSQAAALELSAEALRELALKNLQRVASRPEQSELDGLDGAYEVTVGGGYEASLLLVDQLWRHEIFAVSGEIVVAVPSTDALRVTGSDNPAAIAALRAWCRETAAASTDPVSAELLIRSGKHWYPFTY